MKDKSPLPTLSLDDLEISNLEIYGLTRDEIIGVPEMGASSAPSGSCTCCNCCPVQQSPGVGSV
jgi:hypothetical protein